MSTNETTGELEAGGPDALEDLDAGADDAPDENLDAGTELDAPDEDLDAGADALELDAGADAMPDADASPKDAAPDVSPWNGCTYFGAAYDPNCSAGKFFVGCAGGPSPAPAGCVYFAPYGSGTAFCCAGHP